MSNSTNKKRSKAICSFCGKAASKDDTFIEGPENVCICSECVDLCSNIFTQNKTEQFLRIDSNSYQINIAQIELEETLYTYRDEEMIYDTYFYHDHNLNTVYINSWIEINNLNDDNLNQHIYFASDMITDIADGTFDYDIFSNKSSYPRPL